MLFLDFSCSTIFNSSFLSVEIIIFSLSKKETLFCNDCTISLSSPISSIKGFPSSSKILVTLVSLILEFDLSLFIYLFCNTSERSEKRNSFFSRYVLFNSFKLMPPKFPKKYEKAILPAKRSPSTILKKTKKELFLIKLSPFT